MDGMDVNALKMYMQNIEEYVIDEDRIVTYKWLSKNLDIHVNTAKQLLYYFATEQKHNIHTTYLIGGILTDDGDCKILIVREGDLETIKKQFKVLTSQHVYSIQKAKTLPDLNVLYAVDSQKGNEDENKSKFGAIKYRHPVLIPQEKFEGLRKKSRAESANVNGKQFPAVAVKANKKPPTSSDLKDEVQTSAETSKEKNDGKKNGGIAAMFAAQNNKTKQQDSAEEKTNVADKQAAKPRVNSRISKFFGRQAEKSVEKVSSNVDKSSNFKVKEKEEDDKQTSASDKKTQQFKKKEDEIATNESENVLKKDEKATSNVQNKKTKQTIKKQSKNKKSKSNSEELPLTKKRKRIVVMSDSEESSDDGIFDKDDEDGDDEMPASPPQLITPPEQPESDPEDVIPPTPETKLNKGRKRVRKLKDSTYKDEDGYLITKKEYVFESCTDSEEEGEKENERKKIKENESQETNTISDVKKQPVDKAPVDKKSKLTKQATLMNFFKKNS